MYEEQVSDIDDFMKHPNAHVPWKLSFTNNETYDHSLLQEQAQQFMAKREDFNASHSPFSPSILLNMHELDIVCCLVLVCSG